MNFILFLFLKEKKSKKLKNIIIFKKQYNIFLINFYLKNRALKD